MAVTAPVYLLFLSVGGKDYFMMYFLPFMM